MKGERKRLPVAWQLLPSKASLACLGGVAHEDSRSCGPASW